MIEHQDADLSGSRLRNVDLSGSRIRSGFMNDVVITDAWVEDVRIEGEIVSLTVNGVDVAGYVSAELDRRDPERTRLRARDISVLREAWSDAIARADAAVARARRLPPELLDERVDDEFSFVETLRHLVFASDRWLTGPVFGDPEPYFHPLGQTFEGADERPEELGLDLDAHPSLDEVLEARGDRLGRVAAFLRSATDADLGRPVASPNGGTTTVMDCIHVVLNEEWWHHRYASRDLAILEARPR